MSFIKLLFKKEPGPSSDLEIRAPQTAKIIRDPRVKEPKVLTEEEKKKQLPFRISIEDFRNASLDAVPMPTLFDVARFRQEQQKYLLPKPLHMQTRTDRPSWAYRFDFERWMSEYKITELSVTDIGQFALNWDQFGENYEPETEEERLQQQTFLDGQLTPPATDENGKPMVPEVKEPIDYNREKFRRLIWTMDRDPKPQHATLTKEAREEIMKISGGRIELLADIYRALGIDTLILFDNVADYDRQTALIFYFLDILGPAVTNLHLDRVKAELPICLAENINFKHLDRLTVTESTRDSAWFYDIVPSLLNKWMNTPHEEKKNISFLFIQVPCCPLYIKNFIEDWEGMKTAQIFRQIIFDIDTLDIREMFDCLCGIWSCYQKPHINRDNTYYRELNAYVIHQRKAQFVFPHSTDKALIHYRYREGQYVLTFYPNQTIMLKDILSDRDWRHFIEAGSPFRWDAPSIPKDMIIMKSKPRQPTPLTEAWKTFYESASAHFLF